MSSPPPPPPADALPAAEVSTSELQALIPRYTSKLWRSLVRLVPPPSTGFLTRIWSLYSHGFPTRTLRHKPGLPLPFRSAALALIPATSETSGVVCALHAVLDHVLSCLHKIQKNLQFWHARAEGTDARKVYFMVFERGPSAFIEETAQLIRIYRAGGYSMQSICLSAASSISEKISILTTLQCCLATFLAQVYTEVDKYGDLLTKDPAKALPSLLVAIDSLFSKLEVSLRNPRKSFQWNSSLFTSWDDSFALSFEKLTEILHERERWNHTEIMDAINLIHQNIQRLDAHASSIVKYVMQREENK